MAIDTTKYTKHLSLGKFEGESSATEYFWEAVMNGDGEDYQPIEDEIVFSLFTADYEESEAFKGEDIRLGDTVCIWEDSQGFVNLVNFKDRDSFDRWVSQYLGEFPLA